MFYDWAIVIPKSTTEAVPVETWLELTKGTVHRVEVEFPAGCMGLAHCRIMRGLHQLWPTNPDGSFATDGYTIAFNEATELADEPLALKASGWNLDDTYAHTITWRFALIEASKIGAGERSRTLLERLARLFGI